MMVTKLKRVYENKITGQQLYLATFALYLCIAFLRNTTFNPYIGSKIFNLISYLAVLLLGLKILLYDNYTVRQLLLIGGVFIIAAISWRLSTSNLILVMIMFILAAKNVSFREIIRWYFIINLILLISVVIFSSVGIIRDLVFVVKGRASRYALGITYPTDLAAHVLYLVLANIYLNYQQLGWRHYTFYLLLALVLKLVTDARLSVICLVLTVPIVMIAKRASDHPGGMCQLLVSFYWMITPLLAIITFIGTYFFDNQNKIFYKIDHILSGRLSYGRMALDSYPITWFGQHVIEHGYGGNAGLKLSQNGSMNYFYIDSSYMRLIMISGLIMFILVLGIMMTISVRATICKEYALVAIILVVTLSCTVEQHLLEVSYNPFLLALLAEQIRGKITCQRRTNTA